MQYLSTASAKVFLSSKLSSQRTCREEHRLLLLHCHPPRDQVQIGSGDGMFDMEAPDDVPTHLGQVLAGLALVLVAAGVQVAGDGRDAQVQLAVFNEDVLQVISPHGPGLHQDVVHLHRRRERLVGLLRPAGGSHEGQGSEEAWGAEPMIRWGGVRMRKRYQKENNSC